MIRPNNELPGSTGAEPAHGPSCFTLEVARPTRAECRIEAEAGVQQQQLMLSSRNERGRRIGPPPVKSGQRWARPEHASRSGSLLDWICAGASTALHSVALSSGGSGLESAPGANAMWSLK